MRRIEVLKKASNFFLKAFKELAKTPKASHLNADDSKLTKSYILSYFFFNYSGIIPSDLHFDLSTRTPCIL